IRLGLADDSVCRSRRSATRSSPPPGATTRPPPQSADHENLGHSSTAAEHNSSPQGSTHTPHSSPGKPPAQTHPPTPDAPASHHPARSRTPSQTTPPARAPSPARSPRSALHSILTKLSCLPILMSCRTKIVLETPRSRHWRALAIRVHSVQRPTRRPEPPVSLSTTEAQVR